MNDPPIERRRVLAIIFLNMTMPQVVQSPKVDNSSEEN